MRPTYRKLWNHENKAFYKRVPYFGVKQIIQEFEKERGLSGIFFGTTPARETIRTQIELAHGELDGAVKATKKEFGSRLESAAYVKDYARKLGAGAVGICELDQSYVYEGRTVNERYAISMAMSMDATKLSVQGENESGEVMRAYYELGQVCIRLAEHLRGLGYPARAHHPRGDCDLNHVPIAYSAGLGRLGRHGSLINENLGSWFRLGTVTTNLELEVNQPSNARIVELCDSCRLCVDNCPGDAISDAKMAVANGVLRWTVDTEKCVPYYASLSGCAVCLRVCPFNGRAPIQLLKDAYREDRRHWRDVGAFREHLHAVSRSNIDAWKAKTRRNE